MKFLLFGTGEYYNRYKIWFARKEVLALIDNSKEKQGQYIDGILVISPEDVQLYRQYEYDAIIILSFYIKAMKTQLIHLGVEESKIYHFFDLHSLICHTGLKREIRYYAHGQGNSEYIQEDIYNKILLLSHDLTLGGPALALYHAAQVLVRSGYQVVYGSMLDGPLRNILLEEGIPVIVDENLMIETMREAEWIRGYSLVICNTMNFHVFLSDRDKNIPVAWWLHDSLFFYDGVSTAVMDKLETENMKIWSVGPIPERAVKTFRPDFHVEDLLYGVADQIKEENKSDRHDNVSEIIRLNEEDKNSKELVTKKIDKIRFITIGYIERRKGQDILIEAIRCLESSIRQKAEFFFVGQNTSLVAQELMEIAEDIPEIIVTGPVGREEIGELLFQSNVLVCPSREDPMPTVVAEAMMHGIPCLVSDTTGTVKYLRDGVDGMVFQSGNVEQLAELLCRCIQGFDDLKQMGKNARLVFEKYFSMETFEDHLMRLIE